MTRRLVLALVGTTVAVLVLVGGGTVVLARAGARQATERELRRQVTDLAASIPEEGEAGAGRARTRLLAALRRTLRLDGLTVVNVRADGTVVGDLPTGLEVADLAGADLAAGAVVSGHRDGLVYAAAPIPAGTRQVVIVGTRPVDVGLARAPGWFVVAALLTLGLAVAVAVGLGRRLARPIRQARAITARIADGDLAARLPEPPAADHDELADLARSINAMAASLDRAAGRERQFLLSVSHELRTPLTSIRGYAEAIADGATPDARAAAAVIHTQAGRLERLVADLLDLARLRAEASSFSLHLQPCDLSEAAVAGAEALRPQAVAADVQLAVDAGMRCPVSADGQRLHQVVANVVDNAVHHARTAVTIATAAGDGWAALTVDDDGPGIDPVVRDEVFTRLFGTGRGRAGGTGVGLAIARELTVAMGGTLHAADAPNGGARFVVRLPLRVAP